MGKMGGFGRRQVEEESPLNVPWAPEAQALSNPKGWVQMLDYLKSFRDLALFLQYSFYKHLLNAVCELSSI